MDRLQPDLPTVPPPDRAGRHDASEPHERWVADRERLLTIAGYAETLLEAVRRVDRAYEDARTVLADARREAERVRQDAARDAEHTTAKARGELARLEFQITKLESKRHLIAVPNVGAAAVATAEPATLAAYPSESPAALRHVEPPAEHTPTVAHAPDAEVEVLADEPPEDDVSAHVRSIRQLLEERAERREEPLASPPQRGVSSTVAAAAVVCLVLAVGTTTWWLFGKPGDEEIARAAAAPNAAPAVRTEPTTAAAEPSAASEVTPPVSVPPEKVAVAIRAERATWVRTGSDGVLDRGGIMAAGQQRVVNGEREVEIRTGDGGALLVSVNGGPETRLGKNGADAVRRFARAGQVPSDTNVGATASRDTEAVPAVDRESVATSGITDPPAGVSGNVRGEVTDADRRWFEARYAGADAALRALQAREFDLVDERRAADRPEPAARVEREIRSMQVDTWADHAAASGVMIEHVSGANPRDIMSIFAETWVKRDGRWQLMGVRLTTPGSGSTTR
jgi:hypothetical protein